MAGGTFNRLSGKVRPGPYINFESTRRDVIPIAERGTVIMPLINHDYGPSGEFITLENSSPDASRAKLGYSVYDDHPNMLLLKECFKKAKKIIVYIPRQGKAAAATADPLTGTAQYGGTHGNDFSFAVTENPLGGFDVTKYLGAVELETVEGVKTVEELIAADSGEWIVFTGTGNLTATAKTQLQNGTTGEATVADMTEFLDATEARSWNTLAFPMAPNGEDGDMVPSIQEAIKTKIKYLREDAGKYRTAVVAHFAADYEGIVNVTNGVVLTDGTRIEAAQAVAWVAGATAGASNTTSNTYVKYDSAVDIIGPKSHSESVEAIKDGEFFFSFSEENDVIVEYDINSLTSFTTKKTKDYSKNRVIRVYDTFAESCMLNFPPNKFDNNDVGWDSMDGIGRAILQLFWDAGAIKNVDLDADFKVNRDDSTGDECYFDVGLEAVDSAEKLFFTIRTR